MSKKIKTRIYLLVIFAYCFIGIFKCFAGLSLLQNFTEKNIAGNSEFSFTVSCAGNVNGDGFDDVIVGAPYYTNSKGRAYIYFGGNPMNNTADVIMDGENYHDLFAYSVSNAGDVNNDNYDDIIVGAPDYPKGGETGRAYIYFGGITMDNTADVIVDGENPGTDNNFGESVSAAGNFNGDLFDDVIVGASDYPDDDDKGRAYVYFGGNPMTNTPDVIFDGENNQDEFGTSVSGAGDVNNDNYDDVIVGAPDYPANVETGRAYIYFGNDALENTADVIMDGENPGTDNNFGESVSGAGNVNGDAFDDVIVGASDYPDDADKGRAYIYFGANPMNKFPTPDITFTGENDDDEFGTSVSGAGNVNGDAFDDVIIGASDYPNNGDIGRAYIFYGGNSMDLTPDVIMDGETADDEFGSTVSCAGNVNGDGYDDVIVAAPLYQSGQDRGRAYVFFGGNPMDSTADVIMDGELSDNWLGFSVSGAGNLNGDAFKDVIVGAPGYNDFTGRAYVYYGGSPMDNTVDVIMDGENVGDGFGRSVSAAGNVNGDSFDDVIVGADWYGVPATSMDMGAKDSRAGFEQTVSATSKQSGERSYHAFENNLSFAPGPRMGRAYIFYGGNPMNNVPDVTFTGENPFNFFGRSVSGAGNINGDAFDDVIVGAPGYNNHTGRAYVIYGGNPMDNTVDVIMDGENVGDRFGRSVSGGGNVNGDVFDDVIVGAYWYPNWNSVGRAYVYHGGNPMNNIADVTMTGENTDDYFGRSVSNAGNVNGDAYDDVIIGAPGYPNDDWTGRAYIYFGGSPMNNLVDVVLKGGDPNDSFGWSVSGAGDVNIDSYADVIVGAPGYNSYQGCVYIYYGGAATNISANNTYSVNKNNIAIKTTAMDNTIDEILLGESKHTEFGWSVSAAGDVNGNTTDDIIVGAFAFDGANGKAYVYNSNQQPTAITLSSFYVEIGQDGILIKWGTETEPNNAGFNIYRSTEENGEYDKLNESLIPTQGDATTGATYNYLDKPDQAGDYYYKLQAVSLDGTTSFHGPIYIGLTSVDLNKKISPKDYSLSQNYPNPFNPETTIEFGLPAAGVVFINIYDINGHLVRNLVAERVSAGNHSVMWNGRDNSGVRVVSGVYFYSIKAGDFRQTLKMILVK